MAPRAGHRFPGRAARPLLVAILLLGAGIRLGVHLDLTACDPAFDRPYLDSRNFLEWAGRIAAGDVLGDPRPFFLNPLYPYLLAPVLRLTGEHSLLAVRLLQMALGLSTILLVAGTARRLLDPGVALVAALLAAVYPLLLFYEQQVMIVTLAVFLNALALRLLAGFAASPTARCALLAGVALGLGVLARPNVALFALLLPLWILRLAPRGARLRFAAARSGVLFLGLLLPVLPVTLRNALVGGDLVLTTTSAGVNLYHANNPAAWRTGWMTSDEIRPHPTWMERDSKLVAERALGRPLRPSEVSAYWIRRTIEGALASPGPALLHLGRKLLYFFRSYEIPSSYHYEEIRRESRVLAAIPLSFGILAPLLLLGAATVLHRRREALPLVLMVAAYAAANTLFHPLSHHRAPVLAAAIPLASLGVVELVRAAAGRRRLGLLAGLAALAVLLPLCRLPPDPATRREDRMVFFTNRGVALLDAGRPVPAEVALRKARDANPDAVKPWLGLARLARVQGEPGREAMFLRRCLARHPGQPIALANLGRNLFDGGERAEGLRLAERALVPEPPEAPLYVNLARLYLRSGRFEDALAAYARARGKGLDEPGLYAEESTCLRLLGRPDEALLRARAGLDLSPGFGPLHLEVARILLVSRPADRAAIRREIDAARAAGVPIPPDLADRR